MDGFQGLDEYPRRLIGCKVRHLPSPGRIPCFNGPVTASTENRDTAGIPFPPPLAFIGALGVGFALQYLIPLRILPAATGIGPLEWIGAGLVLAAIALAICTFTCFYLARTSPFPERPTTSLVIRGPFRFTRNPMYLSLLFVLVGWAVYLSNLATVVVFPLFVVYMNRYQIMPEERALSSLFGGEFEAYRKRVRRWL